MSRLKDNFDQIPIPDELDKAIEMGLRKAEVELRRKRNKRLISLAASFVILIGSMGLIGFDRVEAAIRRALQYIPGYNVVVDTEKGEVLALQEPVLYEEDEVYVEIKAASKLGKELLISIESNYKNIKNTEVLIKDMDGNIISTTRWDRAGGGEYWQGNYHFEVTDEGNSYSLILGQMEIPFSLEKTLKVDDFLQLGEHASDKGVTIVAIKKPLEDGLKISLLHQSQDKLVEDYPFEQNLWMARFYDIEKSMYIEDREGNKYYPNIPSSFGNLMSDFYFDLADQEGLKLILPYVKVRYPELKTDKIKIRTPEDGELMILDKELPLGPFSIYLADARAEGEEIIVKFKINSTQDEIIDSLYIRGIDGYGIGPSEEEGFMDLFISKKDVGRTFKLYFTSPTAILKGNWIIDLD